MRQFFIRTTTLPPRAKEQHPWLPIRWSSHGRVSQRQKAGLLPIVYLSKRLALCVALVLTPIIFLYPTIVKPSNPQTLRCVVRVAPQKMEAPLIGALLWPINNLLAMTVNPPSPKPSGQVCTGTLSLFEHACAFAGCIRAFVLAHLAINYLAFTFPAGVYPAFGGAERLEWGWIAPIVVRTLIGTWTICGFWDWVLYFSPLKERLAKYKMNHQYPSSEQLLHDALWTTSASLTAAVIEVLVCYGSCNRLLPDAWTSDGATTSFPFSLSNVLWILLLAHWRLPHFYVVHRVLHPWRSSHFPDVGASCIVTYIHCTTNPTTPPPSAARVCTPLRVLCTTLLA